MLSRPVIIAIAVVLLLAVTFSACSYITWHERDRVIKSAESGSMPARVLIAAANFWACDLSYDLRRHECLHREAYHLDVLEIPMTSSPNPRLPRTLSRKPIGAE